MSIHFRDEIKSAISHPLRTVLAAPFYYGGKAIGEVASKAGIKRSKARDLTYLTNPISTRDIESDRLRKAGYIGYGAAALVAGGMIASSAIGGGAGAGAGAGAAATPTIPATMGTVVGAGASGLINTGINAALPELLPNKNKVPDEKPKENSNAGVILIGAGVLGIIAVIFLLRR